MYHEVCYMTQKGTAHKEKKESGHYIQKFTQNTENSPTEQTKRLFKKDVRKGFYLV